MSYTPKISERLLSDVHWLGRLAANLVSDPCAADDLAQEAWLVAYGGRQQQVAPRSRAWLAGVLRNLAERRRRGERRRTRREHERDAPGPVPSAVELVARAEARQRAAQAVLRLPEPMRETILLRFFEDLSTREIARSQGIEVDTVNRRVRRGLERLRRELDGGPEREGHGVVALLLPLALPRGVASTTASSASTLGLMMGMNTTLVSVSVVSVAIVLAWAGWRLAVPERDATEPTDESAAAPMVSELSSADRLLGVAATSSKRSAADSNAAPARIDYRGTLVAAFADGHTDPQVSGSFTLRERRSGSVSTARVQVTRGEFEFETSAGAMLQATSFELGGLPGAWSRSLEVAAEDLDDSPWRIEMGPSAELRVVSTATGIDLEQVLVLHAPLFGPDDPREDDAPVFESEQRRLDTLATGASPLRIPVEDAELSVPAWVGAPFHQWQRVELRAQAPRTIQLEPGGELELSFTGAPHSAGSEVYLYKHGEGVMTGNATDWNVSIEPAERHVLTGVPPGEYWATLQLDEEHAVAAHRRRLGFGTVDVVAWERAALRIDRDEARERRELTVEVEIVIPPAWELEEFTFEVLPMSEEGDVSRDRRWRPLDMARSGELHSFEVAGVPEGPCCLLLLARSRLAQMKLVTLGPRDPSVVSFELPPPVDVRLLAVDADSGSPVGIARLLAGQIELPEVDLGFVSVFMPEPDGQSVLFRAPRGSRRLIVELVDGRRVDQTVELDGLRREVLVSVE